MYYLVAVFLSILFFVLFLTLKYVVLLIIVSGRYNAWRLARGDHWGGRGWWVKRRVPLRMLLVVWPELDAGCCGSRVFLRHPGGLTFKGW